LINLICARRRRVNSFTYSLINSGDLLTLLGCPLSIDTNPSPPVAYLPFVSCLLSGFLIRCHWVRYSASGADSHETAVGVPIRIANISASSLYAAKRDVGGLHLGEPTAQAGLVRLHQSIHTFCRCFLQFWKSASC